MCKTCLKNVHTQKKKKILKKFITVQKKKKKKRESPNQVFFLQERDPWPNFKKYRLEFHTDE